MLKSGPHEKFDCQHSKLIVCRGAFVLAVDWAGNEINIYRRTELSRLFTFHRNNDGYVNTFSYFHLSDNFLYPISAMQAQTKT